MTYKEAADILDPETKIETLVEIGYYNGFNSDKAQSDAVNEACRIAAEVLRTATDTNVSEKWISVKDRLPKEQGYYLVCCLWGEGTLYEKQGVDLIYFRGKQHWAKHEECITHWTYLPKPPEKGE